MNIIWCFASSSIPKTKFYILEHIVYAPLHNVHYTTKTAKKTADITNWSPFNHILIPVSLISMQHANKTMQSLVLKSRVRVRSMPGQIHCSSYLDANSLSDLTHLSLMVLSWTPQTVSLHWVRHLRLWMASCISDDFVSFNVAIKINITHWNVNVTQV